MGRKKQLDEDIAESQDYDEDDFVREAVNPDDQTIDIYSYSTKDLINKYKAIKRQLDALEDDELERESLRDLLGLLEVELEKNGTEIPE